MQDVTCRAELEIEMSALLWNLLVYTKTCPASSPHYQVNEIEWENCRNRPGRKNNYPGWWSQPHKNTVWLISGKNEGTARGNHHKCRVTLEKQDLSLDLQGWGAMVMTSHAGSWINHPCTAQELLQIPQGQSWVQRMGNKAHFTPPSGWFHQEVSLTAQHQCSDKPDWNSLSRFWKTAGIFPLPFPTGNSYRSFCARLCKWFQCSWTNFPVPKHLISCQKIFMTAL